MEITMHFQALKPFGKNRKYRIRKKVGTKWVSIYPAELHTVNENLKSLAYTEEVAARVIADILADLRLKNPFPKTPENNSNQDILRSFWIEVYPSHRTRQLKAPEKALVNYNAALRVLGTKSITTPTPELTEFLWDKLGKDPRKLRRTITALNSILKYLKKPRIEQLRKIQRFDVEYLNQEDLGNLIAVQKDYRLKLLFGAAFYTGCRLGECFGLTAQNIGEDYVRVTRQMREDGSFDGTKTEQERIAFIPKEGQEIVRKWAEVSQEDKAEIRNKDWSKIVRRDCKRLWKGEGKTISFHGLRHSNAIWLLSKGIPIGAVAQHLGNSVTVCEKYYSGFTLKAEGLALMKSFF
jgi:integrase